MHWNDENMLTMFWSQFKFRITFQLKFLELNIVLHILFIILVKKRYKNKHNKYFNFALYYEIIKIFNFCLKQWKRTILLHFIDVLYEKDRKVAKMWKTSLSFMVAMTTGMME